MFFINTGIRVVALNRICRDKSVASSIPSYFEYTETSICNYKINVAYSYSFSITWTCCWFRYANQHLLVMRFIFILRLDMLLGVWNSFLIRERAPMLLQVQIIEDRFFSEKCLVHRMSFVIVGVHESMPCLFLSSNSNKTYWHYR